MMGSEATVPEKLKHGSQMPALHSPFGILAVSFGLLCLIRKVQKQLSASV